MLFSKPLPSLDDYKAHASSAQGLGMSLVQNTTGRQVYSALGPVYGGVSRGSVQSPFQRGGMNFGR